MDTKKFWLIFLHNPTRFCSETKLEDILLRSKKGCKCYHHQKYLPLSFELLTVPTFQKKFFINCVSNTEVPYKMSPCLKMVEQNPRTYI